MTGSVGLFLIWNERKKRGHYLELTATEEEKKSESKARTLQVTKLGLGRNQWETGEIYPF